MQTRDSGGFDKRTLLAFVLMIVVWVVYTQMMPHREQAPVESRPVGTEALDPTGRRPDSPPAAIERTDLGADRPAAAPAMANRLAGEERLITVDGEHFRAVFSTRGAVLQSWQLADYTDAEEQPVELVQDLPGALGLSISGPQGTVDLAQTVFALEESSEPSSTGGPAAAVRILRFTAEAADDGSGERPLRVERTYRIDPASYAMEMDLVVDGVANFRKDHQLAIAWERGIPNLETQEKPEKDSKAAIALLAENLIKDGYGRGHFGCGCSGGPASEGGERPYEGMLRWCGVKGKYFSGILIPEEELPATVVASSDPTRGDAGMRLVLPLEYEGPSHYNFTVYVGPIDYRILKELDARWQRKLTDVVDFGGKLIAPISKIIFWFLVKAYSMIPNYGVGIILMTILMRLLFHPLNARALKSQRKMQALKPELDALNKTYKDKPEMRTKKMMELHKMHGISPLGGCLPLLPQMPVFYALWSVLPNSIELRKAPFILWMQDLASPDTVGEVMGVPINILPILMALTMVWQQRLTPTDPKQAPLMMMMPVMMLFIFYSMPSGFLLYWTVTNLMMIGQQSLMKPFVLSPGGKDPGQPAQEGQQPRRRGKK